MIKITMEMFPYELRWKSLKLFRKKWTREEMLEAKKIINDTDELGHFACSLQLCKNNKVPWNYLMTFLKEIKGSANDTPGASTSHKTIP